MSLKPGRIVIVNGVRGQLLTKSLNKKNGESWIVLIDKRGQIVRIEEMQTPGELE